MHPPLLNLYFSGLRMMMDAKEMILEPATLTDIPVLSDLLSILFAQEAEFTPNPDAQANGLGLIVGNPAVGVVLVARLEGQVIAMVNLLYTVSTALGGKVAIMEDMVVHPDHRGSGTGSQLLAFAITYARKAGCKRISLLMDGDNESAQGFYGKQGFRMSEMKTMRLSLS